MDQHEGISNFREVDVNGKAVPAHGESTGHGGRDDPAAGRPGLSQLRTGTAALSRINPFIAALWLMATLLLACGLWFLTAATMGVMSPFGPSGPVAQFTYVMMALAPWATIAGLAIFACLLFWHANQWQRRRAAAD